MTRRRSIGTTLSLGLPLLIVAVGAIVAVLLPQQESDWLRLGSVLTFLAAVVLAAVVSLVITVIAFVRREPAADVSLLGAVPAVFVIGVVAVIATGHYQANRERKDLDQVIASLVADPELRRELAWQEPLDTPSARALLSHQVWDLLTPAEVERIWEQRKDIDTGQNYEHLIAPAYTPEHVLREYFDRLMAAELQRSGERSYRSLIYHVTLLRHRNLPQDIIDEILADGDPGLVSHLERNPRLTTNPAYLRRWADVPPQ